MEELSTVAGLKTPTCTFVGTTMAEVDHGCTQVVVHRPPKGDDSEDQVDLAFQGTFGDAGMIVISEPVQCVGDAGIVVVMWTVGETGRMS